MGTEVVKELGQKELGFSAWPSACEGNAWEAVKKRKNKNKKEEKSKRAVAAVLKKPCNNKFVNK